MDGFNGDNACTYAVGKIDLEAQPPCWDVTRESLHLGIAQAKAGNRIGDISHAVQSYCEAAGFSVVREFVGQRHRAVSCTRTPRFPIFGTAGRGAPACARHDHRHRAYESASMAARSRLWQTAGPSRPKTGAWPSHFEHSVAILKDRTEIMTIGWEDPNFTL